MEIKNDALAMKDAIVALSKGATITDYLAGYGTVAKLRKAAYVYKHQSRWKLFLKRPRELVYIDVEYVCNGSGKPFVSCGSIYCKLMQVKS